MSIIAFERLSSDESPAIEKFCENIWIDSKGNCTTVIEIILSQKTPQTCLKGFKFHIAGKISGLEICNELYDNLPYCNWFYSRKGFQELSFNPRIIKGDNLEFQIAEARTEVNYFSEREMTQVVVSFVRPVQHKRAAIMVRFRQKQYAKRYGHQWSVDERIYDRKSILSKTIGIDPYIDERNVLPFDQGYVWVILPPKKLVSIVAPQPRNLRHMEEPGLAMLGTEAGTKHALRMMIHWRTGAAKEAWDAKRLSAVYVDQPLPYSITWGALILAIIGIVMAFFSVMREPATQRGTQSQNEQSQTQSQSGR